MPVKVICSCGAFSQQPDGLRGVELSCDQCGRIYRLPIAEDSLDLNQARGARIDAAELERLASITPNAKQEGAFDPAGPSKAKLVLSLLVLIGVIGLALYGLWWLVA